MCPLRRTGSPSPALIPDADARHRDAETRTPTPANVPGARASPARAARGLARPASSPWLRLLRRRHAPLLVDPGPFTFGEGQRSRFEPQRGIVTRTVPSVGRAHIPPRPRMRRIRRRLDPTAGAGLRRSKAESCIHPPASARADRSHSPPSTTSVTPVMNDARRSTGTEPRSRPRRWWPSGRADSPPRSLPRRPGSKAADAFGALDRTGRETIDADAGRSPLDGERARQRIDARLGGGRMRWPTVPSSCSVALMLRIDAAAAPQMRKRARETLKVPLRSMSITVPKPFGDRFSARQRSYRPRR